MHAVWGPRACPLWKWAPWALEDLPSVFPAGPCGAIAVHLIACAVPWLLPVGMLGQLGAVRGLPGGVVTWGARDGSQSRVCGAGADERIAINIFDFARGRLAGQEGARG
eukprot:5441579-Pyramimonas_sp.AAC.1